MRSTREMLAERLVEASGRGAGAGSATVVVDQEAFAADLATGRDLASDDALDLVFAED